MRNGIRVVDYYDGELGAFNIKGLPQIPGIPLVGVAKNGLVTTSGIIPLCVGKIVTGESDKADEIIKAQTEVIFEILEGILKFFRVSSTAVFHAVVYLRNKEDFPAFREVWEKQFGEGQPPTRTTSKAEPVVDGVNVEIEFIIDIAK